jgi:hypothetical protein
MPPAQVDTVTPSAAHAIESLPGVQGPPRSPAPGGGLDAAIGGDGTGTWTLPVPTVIEGAAAAGPGSEADGVSEAQEGASSGTAEERPQANKAGGTSRTKAPRAGIARRRIGERMNHRSCKEVNRGSPAQASGPARPG